MMIHFLEFGMDKTLAYPGFYDPVLILISLVAAYIGAYAGLGTISHLRNQENSGKRRFWLVFGALALGNGVFVMHFIGMLAYQLPIPVRYSLNLTVVSCIPVILASGWMLHLVSRVNRDDVFPWVGGLIGAAGIGITYYLGVMAMRLDARLVIDPLLFALSTVTSVLLAMLAINARRLVRRLGLDPDVGFGCHAGPIIMALAISGMRYIARVPTFFFSVKSHQSPVDQLVEPFELAIGLAVSFFILITCYLLALYLGKSSHQTGGKVMDLIIVFQKVHRSILHQSLLVSLGVLALIIWIAFTINNIMEKEKRRSNSQVELNRILTWAAYDFESILFDLNVLVGSGNLAEYLESGNSRARKRMERQFQFVAKERSVYDQIRLIDEKGLEVVRINVDQGAHTTIVANEALQDQSSLDSFKQTFSLSQGEIFISRFDLNIAQEKRNKPRKTIIQFATPVFDGNDQKRGVVILNFLGSTLLDRVRNVSSYSENTIYLINQDGHVLFREPQKDVRGLLPGRPITFSSQFPAMWSYLKERGSGVFKTPKGQFLFQTLTDVMPDEAKASFARNKQEWTFVIHSEGQAFYSHGLKEDSVAAVILVGGLFLSFFVAWVASVLIVQRKLTRQSEVEALRELKYQKQAMDAHAIVSSADIQGNITYVNDKFVTISGYAREELLGRNHRMVKSDEHSPEFYRDMWKTIANGRPWHAEIKNLTKDGRSYWMQATIVPFLDARGKPFKYVAIRTDITAIKVLEQALITARDVANEAVRAKSDFLANMSHEIRTPMNAIIGLSHLCLQTHLTAHQRDYIRKVHNAATSLLHIINDILDFSKIAAGRLDMESIDFTLDAVIDSVVSMISLKAQEKRLELLVETAGNVPTHLVGDPLRLGQILINLANNAIKFTEAGEIAVATAVLEQGEDFVQLQFTMRDTGIGMTPEQRAGLFKAFSQADASITRKYGGTGLGLIISQRLIAMMAGSIRVESDFGVGSQFVFDARFGVSNQVAERSLLPTTGLRGRKVLVVDDNESARNVLSDYLTSFTFRVTQAMDGKEAMVAVLEADRAGKPFDLVIMDYLMPVMDGITAATNIRNALGVSKQPVVIMATAYGDEGVVQRATSEARVNGFLIKPVSQSALFEAIMDAFGQKMVGRKSSPMVFDGSRDFKEVLSGAKILLVEDNEINQQVAREILQQANITVFLAKNGQEAVALVAREQLDGVLMDVQMPVMDGLTATREVRKHPKFATLPILAMTANAMSGDREVCLEAGMQDHIAKPVDPGNMFATLARWIKPAFPQPLPVTVGEALGEGVEEAASSLSLPEIPGIDVITGLRRMGDNLKGYLGLLAKFRANQGGAGDAIREALAKDDRATAERLAHTLKGVAATIGADGLTEKAGVLEGAIGGWLSPECVEGLLNDSSGELARICAALDHALPEEKTAIRSPLISASAETEAMVARRNALLRKAARQLDIFDASVENTLATLQKEPLSEALRDWMDKIEKQISQYDFEDAAETLKRCMAELGVDLEIKDG